MSDEEKKEVLQPYVQRENCTEEEVNALIKVGYTPWQVTPVQERIQRNGVL